MNKSQILKRIRIILHNIDGIEDNYPIQAEINLALLADELTAHSAPKKYLTPKESDIYLEGIKAGKKVQKDKLVKRVEEIIGEDEKREIIKIPLQAARKGFYTKTKDPGIYVRNKLRQEQRKRLSAIKQSTTEGKYENTL